MPTRLSELPGGLRPTSFSRQPTASATALQTSTAGRATTASLQPAAPTVAPAPAPKAPQPQPFIELPTTQGSVPTGKPGPMLTVNRSLPSAASRVMAQPTKTITPTVAQPRIDAKFVPVGIKATLPPGSVGTGSGKPAWWPEDEKFVADQYGPPSPPAPNGTTVTSEQPATPPPSTENVNIDPVGSGGGGGGGGLPPALIDTAEKDITVHPGSPLPVVDLTKARATAADGSTSSQAVKYGVGGLVLAAVGFFAYRKWLKKNP